MDAIYTKPGKHLTHLPRPTPGQGAHIPLDHRMFWLGMFHWGQVAHNQIIAECRATIIARAYRTGEAL